MTNFAVVGCQWGDEGKGKVVDLLASRFAVVARYQGGPNAGHTVAFEGKTFFLHHIPSGIFHERVTSVIGNGTVVDPDGLLEELKGLEDAGYACEGRLLLSDRAHVILPFHKALDTGTEDRLAGEKIGTTRRGMGPVYTGKISRCGVRVGDLAHPDRVAGRVEQALGLGLAAQLDTLGASRPDPRRVAEQCGRWHEAIAGYVTDTGAWLGRRLEAGATVLFEGAQGTLLDIDHGTYPYVTSSTSCAGGIAPGLGVGPRWVHEVVGVMKAYCTRVGAGPFPTELPDAVGDRLRELGHEYGTTTGRPRRCGWFDAVAARYAVRINGLSAIALSLFDVLADFDEVKVCTAYRIDGGEVHDFPGDAESLARAEPVYETIPGWKGESAQVSSFGDLPPAARRYVDRIAELAGAPVALVSVGPDRSETLIDPAGLLGPFADGGAS